MKVGVKIRGGDRIRERLRALGEAGDRAAREALATTADEVAARAVELIDTGPKTGRVYPATEGFGARQASAPGEPPARDTGNLSGLIGVDEVNLPRMRVAIFSSAEYSADLEFGTSKMAPRPFLRRALREIGPRIVQHLRARGIRVR